MKKRPASSYVGIGDAIISTYSASKVRKLGSDFNKNIDNLRKEVNLQNERLSRSINELADLHVASMSGIYNIHLEVQKLSKSQWGLIQHFKNIQAEQNKLNKLKLFLMNVKKEVKKIRTISQTHPVYAVFMAENLSKMFNAQNVRIEQFKALSVSELEWADEIIDSVAELHTSLVENLE